MTRQPAVVPSATVLGVIHLVVATLLVGLPGRAAGGRGRIEVTTTSDGVPGSLRAAVSTANGNDRPDTIVLRNGRTYELTVCGGPGEGDTNAHGDLDHAAPEGLRIMGTATIRNTCPAERLIEVLPGAGRLQLGSQTLTGGASNGAGGAIQTYDTPVTIVGGVVTGNSASGSGGGLSSAGGDVTVIDATFARNGAGSDGGAIEGSSAADLAITRSTFAGNDGTEGGAIRSDGRVTIRNGTFSGNTASGAGGMMVAGGLTRLNNVTVVGNTAPAGTGGGIRLLPSAVVTLSNTLLDGNGGESCVAGGGTLTSRGHNISSDASCNLTGPGDQPSTDPKLAPLADNGGPTETHALTRGSPAVDAGSPASPGSRRTACEVTDQRGLARNCDIGAYEVVRCAGVPVNRIGTSGDDVLRGTAERDGVLGRGGRDRLIGKGGKDGLCGGPGEDRLNGGGGRDACIGQGARDRARRCERARTVP